ncbi:MBL fold metallo-hydrolase [Immundisolibacter sp.]|uniref:MBL fold metallo-hydrolase n=1 Tax=Immundisolibacter sp. TaxID=1934948 RepID=UPI003568A147
MNGATPAGNPFDTSAVRQEFPFSSAVDVWPGVRRITAPNPGFMTGPGTNTYLVGTQQVLVIDTASDDPAHLEAIKRAAGGAVTAVLVTHAHPDHASGALELARDCGVPVYGSGIPLAGVSTPGFAPDQVLADGDVLMTDAGPVRALRTPGHAADHICYLLEKQGLLFAGDHLMEGTTVVIAPPDGDMAAYLASLRRLQNEPVERIAPGHGRLMHGAHATLQQVIDHRLAREAGILSALAGSDGRTIPDLVAELYAQVPEVLHRLAQMSVYAHLIKLAAEGRVVGVAREGLWRLAPSVTSSDQRRTAKGS